jgi:hypothetical protein
MIIFHEVRFMTCEQTEHAENEGDDGASHREESCETHIDESGV